MDWNWPSSRDQKNIAWLRRLPTRSAVTRGPDLAFRSCQLAVLRIAEINAYDIRGESGAVCRGLDLRPVRALVRRVIERARFASHPNFGTERRHCTKDQAASHAYHVPRLALVG